MSRTPFSMFSKLLVAFAILWNHFNLAKSTCSSADVEFLSSISDNNKNFVCRNSLNQQDYYLCRDSSVVDDHIVPINKSNEAVYHCCCTNQCEDCPATPITLFAGPLLEGPASTTKEEHAWGDYFQVQCPYVPGPLVGSYEFQWRLKNFAGETSLQLNSDDFTNTNNTLNGKLFNPLDIGNYSCEVSREGRLETGIVQVTLAEDKNRVSNITAGPSSRVFNNINVGSIDFRCTASVPSFKLIGFSINQTNGSEQFEIIQNSSICEYTRSNPSTLKCEKSNAMLTCSYDKPHEIDCTLSLEEFETQSSYVSCFIAELDGSKLDSDAATQSAGLFTIPSINCSEAFVADSKNKRVTQPFPYPITVSPVTVEFFNNTDPSNVIMSMPGELDDTKTMVTFKVPDDNVNSYRIVFNNDNTMTTGSCGVPAFPTVIPSPPPSTMTTASSTDSVSPSISASSASSMSSSTRSNNPTEGSPSPTPAIPPSSDSIANIAIPSSVAGFIGLLLVIAILIVLLVIITRMTKSSNKRKGDYQIAHNNGSPIATCHNDVESGNPMRPMNNNNYLSPDHPGQCDSCSQASTLDTFIGEDNTSPRHQERSNNSNSSHSHSSNSCPSTRHLKNKPLPRYGIPDHHHQQYQLQPTSLHYPAAPPEISVITPTPTMEDQPVLGGGQYVVGDCISPTGTEPFSSPITPMDDTKQDDYFTAKKEQSRPSDLPIGPSAKTPDSAAATPLSDQTMIGVLLYLQHKDCNKRDNCQTCKLIDRHFVRIANKYGQNALTGMMKNLNTPGAEGTLKHLRKKKIQKARSPHRPQQAPSLSVVGYQRQRSHSASHLDDEELTFSSTETDEDSLKPSNKRIKPMRGRKAVTDDEREGVGYYNQRSLPLQRINETLSLSHNDIASTPLDCPPGVVLPNSLAKGSESDSTDGSTTSRIEPQFDSSKPSGLSMSFMKSPEESLPINFHPEQDIKKHLSTMNSYSASSGYDTDSVFDHQKSSADERGESPPQHIVATNNGVNGHLNSSDFKEQSTSDYRYKHYDSSSDTHSYRSQGSNSQSDYIKAAQRKNSSHQLPMHLSPSNSGVLSMHSSPGNYRSQGSTGGRSNQSNNSIHSEGAVLQNHSHTQSHKFSSPPGQRRNNRTPSPIQYMLPSSTSSATPI